MTPVEADLLRQGRHPHVPHAHSISISSRASYHEVYYTSSSAQYAKIGQSQDIWQVRR